MINILIMNVYIFKEIKNSLNNTFKTIKFFFYLVLISFIVFSNPLLANDGDHDSSEDAHHSKEVLTIAVDTEANAKILESMLRSWSDESNHINFKIIVFEKESRFKTSKYKKLKIVKDISSVNNFYKKLLRKNQVDVFLVNLDQTLLLKNYLQNLNKYLAFYLYSGKIITSVLNSQIDNFNLYGLPLYLEKFPIKFYNKKLFKQHGIEFYNIDDKNYSKGTDAYIPLINQAIAKYKVLEKERLESQVSQDVQKEENKEIIELFSFCKSQDIISKSILYNDSGTIKESEISYFLRKYLLAKDFNLSNVNDEGWSSLAINKTKLEESIRDLIKRYRSIEKKEDYYFSCQDTIGNQNQIFEKFLDNKIFIIEAYLTDYLKYIQETNNKYGVSKNFIFAPKKENINYKILMKNSSSYPIDGKALVVSKKSNNKELAVNFLTFVTTTRIQNSIVSDYQFNKFSVMKRLYKKSINSTNNYRFVHHNYSNIIDTISSNSIIYPSFLYRNIYFNILDLVSKSIIPSIQEKSTNPKLLTEKFQKDLFYILKTDLRKRFN